MEFEWDSAKSDATAWERGFDFAYAVSIFQDGRLYEWADRRFDYGELRMRAIGMTSDGDLLHVAYTMRESVCRIISARKAKGMRGRDG